jgi:hypothetical protein
MDKNEARSVLARHIEGWRRRSYQELVTLLGHQRCEVVLGPSGAEYQIEVDVMWDDKAGGCVRVLGCIDDGHLLAALRPLMEDFIMAPDGRLVGEQPPNQPAAAAGGRKPASRDASRR